jgi:hypothetical protein
VPFADVNAMCKYVGDKVGNRPTAAMQINYNPVLYVLCGDSKFNNEIEKARQYDGLSHVRNFAINILFISDKSDCPLNAHKSESMRDTDIFRSEYQGS